MAGLGLLRLHTLAIELRIVVCCTKLSFAAGISANGLASLVDYRESLAPGK